MNPTPFSILIALAAGLFVWGAALMIAAALRGDKRRLKQRLATDGAYEAQSALRQSVRLQSSETGLSAKLARRRWFDTLNQRLLQAWPGVSLVRFLGIVAGAAVATAFVAAALFPFLVALLFGACAAWVPFLLLNARRNRRQRAIAMQLPEAMDFLSRVLRAGHSLTTGLQMLGDEIVEPLADEFRRCYSQHSLGQPLEDCLKEMAARIDSTDFAFFVTAVLVQRQTGGDLAEVLDHISSMIRQRIRLQQQIRSKTAEGRLSGYILIAFPVIMFAISYVMNPKYTRIMLDDSAGLKMLAVAVFLELMGLYAIRKITAFKV